jgi:hypothetical protein
MYITSLKATQTGEADGLFCPVLVEWSFGNRLPNIVEIYADDTPIQQLTVKDSKNPISTTVSLRAGSIVKVSVCPRFVKDDSRQDKMPNAQGENQSWESFCLIESITTRAKAGTGEVTSKKRAIPQINSIETIPASAALIPPLLIKQKNRIRVRWSCSEDYGSYLVGWRSNYDQWNDGSPRRQWRIDKFAPVGGEIRTEEGGKSASFDLEAVMPGLEYEFSVKGRGAGLGIFEYYSEWSLPKRVVADENLTSLRQYLLLSGLKATNGIRQYLFADSGSLRSFMQLQ